MSDTAWTIAGFALVGLGVLVVVGIAPFFLMMGDSTQGEQYAKTEGRLVIAAVAVPPLVIGAIYLTAIALAWRSSGPTAYYPWIVVVIAVPLWFAMASAFGHAKSNLMYWLPRSRDTSPATPQWTGTPQTSADALAALQQWGAQQGLDIAITDVHADRFPYGWTIYTPQPAAPGDPQAVLDAAEPVYLVGDSGAITRHTSGNLHNIVTQFSREEIRRRTRP